MRVVEEPFVTRETIVSALRPGQHSSKSAFRTLRETHKAASPGLQVNLRLASGRLEGRFMLYSSLNADAARTYRYGQPAAARRLAHCAQVLEHRPAAREIWQAVRALADEMPADPLGDDVPGALRHYVELRRPFGGEGLDPTTLVRQWLTRSSSWLTSSFGDRGRLIDAIEELALEAEKARAKILKDEIGSASTFFGFVRVMDRARAGIESENGELVVIRRLELERQGLASIGQPVALLQESMADGGFLTLPMSAAMVEEPDFGEALAPAFDDGFSETGARVVEKISSPHDAEWLERAFAKDPSVVPVGVIPVQ